MTELKGFRTPQQDRSRQSFERVLEAATELLGEKGYEQLTLAEVSQRAGVSTGSIYGRVRGKEDLLDAVQVHILERVERQQTELLDAIRAERLPFDALVVQMVTALGEFLRAQANLLRPLMARAPSNPTVATLGKRSFHKLKRGWADTLLDHRAEIGHPRPEHAVDACFSLAYAAFARYLGLGSAADVAGEGDWDELGRDLGEMSVLFLRYRMTP
ncbi:TetR/AcrR family transcriptional regulator [Deinococcus aestuarii]|uniref:TetR/AcrR family transcriptional regulator n=1 Tax=Deinococcus aestuarii TaxID=2774531 RepID=UPI001C0C08FD|nr:TetR/AcrR family transcriptional regulator [Deinococcus aestuarii]